MTVAWLSHIDDMGFAKLIWNTYRHAWSVIPFPFIGFIIKRLPMTSHSKMVKLIIGFVIIACLIGILQTLSSGALLSGFVTNQLFLGFLTPLPSKLFAEIAAAGADNGVFIGSIFRAHGTLLQTNHFSALLVALGGFVLGVVISGEYKRLRKWALVSLILVVVAIVATFGITSYFAFTGLIAYVIVSNRRQLIKYLFKNLAILFLALFGIPLLIVGIITVRSQLAGEESVFTSRLDRFFRPEESNGFNSSGRIWLWSVVLDRVSESPILGTGRQITAREARWEDSDTAVGAHNIYLMYALYTGLPGQAMFIGLFCWIVIATKNVAKSGSSPSIRSYALSAHYLSVGLAILGVSFDWVVLNNVALLFWFLGGMCISSSKNLRRQIVR